MGTTRTPPGLGAAVYSVAASALALYFTFAAVQGDYGLFRRVQVEAEIAGLREELARGGAELERMRNLTMRLSDDFLDLDLLDARAREVLGYVRADEIVIP